MPGLIRGVARTAVVAGTATAVSNRVSRRQAARWNDHQQEQYGSQQEQYGSQRYEEQAYQPSPPPPARDPGADRLEQLRQLGELKAQGVLTDAEFEREKALLLHS
ncbi:MAG TPA: SHOCT domain-containing protein [Kineosporiaceae bacterium]|nr:SHOCT domain-containing protein [Kineosporiaceae bacterium]